MLTNFFKNTAHSDVIIRILSFLDNASLTKVAEVCRQLNALTQNEKIWKQRALEEFNIQIQGENSLQKYIGLYLYHLGRNIHAMKAEAERYQSHYTRARALLLSIRTEDDRDNIWLDYIIGIINYSNLGGSLNREYMTYLTNAAELGNRNAIARLCEPSQMSFYPDSYWHWMPRALELDIGVTRTVLYYTVNVNLHIIDGKQKLDDLFNREKAGEIVSAEYQSILHNDAGERREKPEFKQLIASMTETPDSFRLSIAQYNIFRSILAGFRGCLNEKLLEEYQEASDQPESDDLRTNLIIFLLKPMAQNKNLAATCLLGDAYSHCIEYFRNYCDAGTNPSHAWENMKCDYNINKAKHYYQLGTKLHYGYCHYRLGCLYGDEGDFKEAYKQFKLGEKYGCKESAAELIKLYFSQFANLDFDEDIEALVERYQPIDELLKEPRGWFEANIANIYNGLDYSDHNRNKALIWSLRSARLGYKLGINRVMGALEKIIPHSQEIETLEDEYFDIHRNWNERFHNKPGLERERIDYIISSTQALLERTVAITQGEVTLEAIESYVNDYCSQLTLRI